MKREESVADGCCRTGHSSGAVVSSVASFQYNLVGLVRFNGVSRNLMSSLTLKCRYPSLLSGLYITYIFP